MVTEKVSLTEEEENILKESVGKKMLLVTSADDSNFSTDFNWTIYFSFEKFYIKIEREDIVAKFFDAFEDGGRPKVERISRDEIKKTSTKTINRIVKDVDLISVTAEFSNYKITYPKAIVFKFDDCNLVIEKFWLFSLAGFKIFLNSADTENFGLTDELQFWYNAESNSKKPIITQEIKAL